MAISVKVLGSGNAFNQERRFNSSYFVDFSGKKILVDCGFTTPLALQINDIGFNDIDAVLITHYHGDHYAGLSAFLLGLKYISVQSKPLTIIGPGDVQEKLRELMRVMYAGTEGILNDLNLEFLSVKQSGDQIEWNDVKIDVLPMIHSEEALPVAYVLNGNNQSLGFSGDTCWHEGVEELIRKSNKTFLECNFIERIGEGHVSVEELEASPVVQGKKESIYLTHLFEGSFSEAKRLGYNCVQDKMEFQF